MGQFSTEFPNAAAQVLIDAIIKKDGDKGRIALAGYDLLGFGLFKYFGDVKYLMAATSDEDMKAILASAPPHIAKAIDGLKTLDPTQPIPDWAIPLIMQAVQWLVTTLLARINKA